MVQQDTFLCLVLSLLKTLCSCTASATQTGGAILIDSTGGNFASARLLRTTIRDCQAFFNGGAVALQGSRATLFLEEGTLFEMNQAKVGNGGALYAEMATIQMTSSKTSSVPVRIVRG